MLLCQTYIAESQSWLNPWQARQSVSIINYNLQDLVNYQVKLELTYQDCMDSLFTDIRFTNDSGTYVLPHWTQYVDPGKRAVVYVKVGKLAAYSSGTIYWYFENASATDSNDPDATLIYYDDLDEDLGWASLGGGSVSFTTFDGHKVLRKDEDCDNQGAWLSLGDTIPDFKLLVKDYRPPERSADCPFNEYGVETDSYRGLNFLRGPYNTSGNGLIGIETRDGNSVTDIVTENVDQLSGRWYHTEVSYCHICLFNTNAQLWSDSMDLMGNVYSSNYNMYDFDRVTMRGAGPYLIDYIAVASKACIEPIVTFGTIQYCPNAILVNYAADYCQEDEGQITLRIEGGAAPYTLTWFRGTDSIGTASNLSTDNFTLDRLPAGQYRFEVTDSNACQN